MFHCIPDWHIALYKFSETWHSLAALGQHSSCTLNITWYQFSWASYANALHLYNSLELGYYLSPTWCCGWASIIALACSWAHYKHNRTGSLLHRPDWI
jgi:hypothetical protein